MVIHTKEKPKLKVKGAPETKIKGRNVLTVQHGLKTGRLIPFRKCLKNDIVPVRIEKTEYLCYALYLYGGLYSAGYYARQGRYKENTEKGRNPGNQGVLNR